MLATREKQYAINRQRYVKLLSMHVDQQKVELSKRQKRSEKRREKEQARERVGVHTMSSMYTYIHSIFIGTDA